MLCGWVPARVSGGPAIIIGKDGPQPRRSSSLARARSFARGIRGTADQAQLSRIEDAATWLAGTQINHADISNYDLR
jgi:hypothetical protein